MCGRCVSTRPAKRFFCPKSSAEINFVKIACAQSDRAPVRHRLIAILTLDVLDDTTLRGFATTSRAMRFVVAAQVRHRLHISHSLRCALLWRRQSDCARCGVPTRLFVRQHRLRNFAMCERCQHRMLRPATFADWLFLRRKRPYTCDRDLHQRGGRVWRCDITSRHAWCPIP